MTFPIIYIVYDKIINVRYIILVMTNRLLMRTAKNSGHYLTLTQQLVSDSISTTDRISSVVKTTQNGDTNVTAINGAELLLTNDDNTATINITDNGEVILNSGVSYKVVNETEGVISTMLTNNDYFITFSNPLSESVTLPSASDNPGQYYIISRNYARIETGPRAESPFLIPPYAFNILSSGGDSIDQPGNTSTGVTPYTRQKIISDGIDRWYIV
jgi:hypothetical protein